jgi:hypothetical protein
VVSDLEMQPMVTTFEPHPSSERTTTELHLRVRYASLRLESGDSPPAATTHVMQVYGIDERTADLVVTIARRLLRQSTREIEHHEARESATKHLVIGGITCFAGIAIVAAAGNGVIAWGAIVFGGVQFLRGLYASR